MSLEVHLDEKELVQQLAASSEKAFETLYARYMDTIYGVAFQYTKSASFAEEIVQDVFLKLWGKRQELLHVESISNYLFIMARNLILTQLKSIARNREHLHNLSLFFENNTLDPAQELAFKEARELLDTAIAQLPEQQRMVYRLSKQEGLSREAIARQLNLSENTVKNHLGRAMQYLRAYLSTNTGDVICLIALLLLEL